MPKRADGFGQNVRIPDQLGQGSVFGGGFGQRATASGQLLLTVVESAVAIGVAVVAQ